MPTYRITGPDGKAFDVTAPDGATEDQVLAYAQKNFKMAAAPATPAKSKGFGEQLNDFIDDVPRQAGLTARAGLQGVGNSLSALAAPLRVGANAILPASAQISGKPAGTALADAIGLPAPQTAGERIVGDAAGMVAGGVLPIGIGSALARGGSGLAARAGQLLSANPGQQLASAAASGAAGGYTRETGGDTGSQLAASLAAGIATPFALGAAGKLAQSARTAVAGRPVPPPQQIDITINNALRGSGLSMSSLPSDVAATIRKDVQAAYKLSDSLTPDAVRRLADYRLTGLAPTAARLSQDPAAITQQENLMKLSANSRDIAAHDLVNTKHANNRALISGLNSLGANTSDDVLAGGAKVISPLRARDQNAQELIGKYYSQARATDGRSALLDPPAFAQRANNALDEALLGGAIPSDIRELMNGISNGKIPFTVDVAEQFKTRLGDAARDAAARGEKSTAKAVGMVRSALDDTPLLDGQEMGQEAIDAFKLGRRMNATYMQSVEKTPALQAVRDGIEPDKFVQQFIIGGGPKSNVMDVAQLKGSIRNRPDAIAAVKEQIALHLKSKALSGAADEVGNFSQSAYNKALNAIGDRKLRLFFEPQEVAQLKAIGRVASYEQAQPVGSAVNNSNTAGAVGNILERVANSSLIGKLPFGVSAIREPVQNIVIGQRATQALDAPRAIAAPMLGAPQSRQPLGVSPAAALGAVGYESDEDRQRRAKGLLGF